MASVKNGSPEIVARESLKLQCLWLAAESRAASDRRYSDFYAYIQKPLSRRIRWMLDGRKHDADDVFSNIMLKHFEWHHERVSVAHEIKQLVERVVPPTDEPFLGRRLGAWRAETIHDISYAMDLPRQLKTKTVDQLEKAVNESNGQLQRGRVEGVSILDRYLFAFGLTIPLSKNADSNAPATDTEAESEEAVQGKDAAQAITRAYHRRLRHLMKLPDSERRDAFLKGWAALAAVENNKLTDFSFDAGVIAYGLARIRFQQVGYLYRSADNLAKDWHRSAEKFKKNIFKKDIPSEDDAVDEVDEWDVIRPGHEDEFEVFNPMQIVLIRQAFEKVEDTISAPLLDATAKLSKPIDAAERRKIEEDIKMFSRRVSVFQVLADGFAEADRENGYTQEEIATKLGLTRDQVRTTLKHIESELMRLKPNLILEVSHGR